MFSRALDTVGYHIVTLWTPIRQLRSGVVLTGVGLLAMAYGPLSDEPFLIFEMSALALVLGGLGLVVTAALAIKQDPDSSEDDLRP